MTKIDGKNEEKYPALNSTVASSSNKNQQPTSVPKRRVIMKI